MLSSTCPCTFEGLQMRNKVQ